MDDCEYSYANSGLKLNVGCQCDSFKSDFSRVCQLPTKMTVTTVSGVHTKYRFGKPNYEVDINTLGAEYPQCIRHAIYGDLSGKFNSISIFLVISLLLALIL